MVDIVELEYSVEIRGKNYETPGLKLRALGKLLVRFPEVRKQIETGKFDLEALLELSDEAIAAVIAAGLGKIGDKKTESWAARLSLGEQAELLFSVYNATVGPKGVGPFVQLLAAVGMVSTSAAAPSDTGSGTTSHSEQSRLSSEDGQKAA